MKLMNNLMALGLGLLVATTSAMANSKYVAGKYQIDPFHSKVGFEVPHLVVSSVEGKFNKFEGTIELAEKFEKSKAKMTAEVQSIDTGVEKRDEHLRTSDFFEVAKYKDMKFVSTSIKGNPAAFDLIGDLTIKGVTKKVTFKGKFLGSVVDGYGNQKVAFKASAKIKRKDFGITYGGVVDAGPVIGDEVTIDLNLQAALEKNK